MSRLGKMESVAGGRPEKTEGGARGRRGGRVVGVVVVEGGGVGLEHGFKADIPLPNHD